jgi:MFS family permease
MVVAGSRGSHYVRPLNEPEMRLAAGRRAITERHVSDQAMLHAANPPAARAAMVLLASCLAMLAVGINSTAIMAALPTMRTDFGLGELGTQWTINAYLVVSASCIVLGGKAADLFGARPVSMAGLTLFGVASCVIALAGSETALLVGRGLQGFSAAFAVPCTLAAVGTSAAPQRRAISIGGWSGSLMLGFSIGPLFGGALTHYVGWRVIFWLNIPLMCTAIAGLAASRLAPAHRDGLSRQTADWKGFVLLATAMVSTVLALQALPHAAAAPLAVFGPLALAAAAFAMLLSVERRTAAPLIDLSFFVRRNFVLGVSLGAISMFGIMSLLLYFNLYAQSQDGLGLTPLQSGAALLPLSAALLALALAVSTVTGRIGLRRAMMGSMGLIVAASAIIGIAVSGGGILLMEIGFVVMGAGLALPYAAAPRLALSALSQEQAGQGSGIINACTFLAGSVGVAGGAIAWHFADFPAVLAMIALAGACGIGLGRAVSEG